eukprot:CAMPEP_0185599290 /NCGR_PEP_ID=MMETSP0434-20130131/82590_1 /TAXON_ID=626734 ORGANISM="Favella taraikaensis, Strain Fe Narragansett Bay" /NCGR_SAMPLE_ID=MMETSP0434 /ASSEMBLY_ACC=CAM_ASM_000379 /LENGTH=73 /DNA_ID=CAMNT_0028228609 /DNA_START=952 /DNA_END=1173 /DNA_ORIENTATION=+
MAEADMGLLRGHCAANFETTRAAAIQSVGAAKAAVAKVARAGLRLGRAVVGTGEASGSCSIDWWRVWPREGRK